MRHWRKTENSNVTIQTGSTYISDSMTDITTIPTANLGFSTRASLQKVSASVCNIEQQPEIATWPPIPEVVIPPELQQIASKFQRQVRNFRPWRARIVSPSDCDNDRQPEMAMWPSKPEILIYLELWQIGRQFQRQFDHAQREETDTGLLRQRPTTGNGHIDILLANHAISGSRSLSQSFG